MKSQKWKQNDKSPNPRITQKKMGGERKLDKIKIKFKIPQS